MSRLIPPDPEEDLRDVEQALASLSPRGSGVDRDRLMFEAGRQSAKPRWVWPSATAALAFLAMGEAALLGSRLTAEPRVIERIVEVKTPSSEALAPVVILRQNPTTDGLLLSGFSLDRETSVPANQNYFQLREQALRFGVDSLPTSLPLAARTDPSQNEKAFRSEIQSLLDPGETL